MQTADGSFYGFISDRLRLRDPSRDPRLKALAKQLRPEDVDRTIQVSVGRPVPAL